MKNFIIDFLSMSLALCMLILIIASCYYLINNYGIYGLIGLAFEFGFLYALRELAFN